MTENWKPVVGFEGAYEVSDRGRVRSSVRGQILRPQRHSGGYVQVSLGRGNTRLVATLVLEAFAGPRPAGLEVCHNDGDKQNNAFANLRWDCHVKNCADRVRHGSHPAGERNGQAILTEEKVRRIRHSRLDRNFLARWFGVSPKHIDRLRRGERWTHV